RPWAWRLGGAVGARTGPASALKLRLHLPMKAAGVGHRSQDAPDLGGLWQMCGIVGYVGHRNVRALLLQGLEQLEYRGYDSAGISVLDGERIDAVRAVGNLSALRAALNGRADEAQSQSGGVAVAERPQPGTGIGHTRWATHGRVTEENAHPH